jgi:hypothetical protein
MTSADAVLPAGSPVMPTIPAFSWLLVALRSRLAGSGRFMSAGPADLCGLLALAGSG